MAHRQVQSIPDGDPVPATGLTVFEVSDRLRIPPPTLYRWRKLWLAWLESDRDPASRPEGPASILVGGQIRYPEKAVRAYEEELRERGRQAMRDAGLLAG